MKDQCCRALERLSQEGLINLDTVTGECSCRPEAAVMSRQMVQFNSMIVILALSPLCSLKELFRELSACAELQVVLKRDDKKILNEHAKHMEYPFKLSEKVKTDQI